MRLEEDLEHAIDGSKFRAVNDRKQMYNEMILKKKLARIEDNITKYLGQLDQSDQSDSETSHDPSTGIQQKLDELKRRKDTYTAYLQELQETGATQKLTTDP